LPIEMMIRGVTPALSRRAEGEAASSLN